MSAERNSYLLFGWVERFGFDDLQLWEHLPSVLPTESPLRTVTSARVGQLRIDYGLGVGHR